jgi:farnesyl diphosphate synthase
LINFDGWRSAIIERTEQALAFYLPAADTPPQQLHQAMRYAVLGNGKRIRPLLCHAAGAVTGATAIMLDAVAAALECMHCYSLIHDDLPLMDNDAMRHGKAAVHVRYGEAIALLAGDALQAQAFMILTTAVLRTASVAVLVNELAQAAGSLGMAGGQTIDLESTGMTLSPAALKTMHTMKTGALLKAAVRMGALCGKLGGKLGGQFDDKCSDKRNGDDGRHRAQNRSVALQDQALEHYADAIGLAFQIVDDVLDVTADTSTLGKTAGKDAQNSKPTYVSMLGLDASCTLAKRLCDEARQALAPLGVRAQRLTELAELIVARIS